MKENILFYIPPIGEELQHVIVPNEGLCLHSDTYLLAHIQDMKLSDNMLNAIESRLSEVKDSMSEDLRQSFDKLTDFQKMDFTDSRYAQFLSDRIEKTKQFMSDLDNEVKEKQNSEESKKLDIARKNLRDFIIRLSSPDDVIKSDDDS